MNCYCNIMPTAEKCVAMSEGFSRPSKPRRTKILLYATSLLTGLSITVLFFFSGQILIHSNFYNALISIYVLRKILFNAVQRNGSESDFTF